MTIVISVSGREDFAGSEIDNHIREVCNHVVPEHGDWLVIPRPGKLMDLLKILNEYDIDYHIQELQTTGSEL